MKLELSEPMVENQDAIGTYILQIEEPSMLVLSQAHRPYMINSDAFCFYIGSNSFREAKSQESVSVGYDR